MSNCSLNIFIDIYSKARNPPNTYGDGHGRLRRRLRYRCVCWWCWHRWTEGLRSERQWTRRWWYHWRWGCLVWQHVDGLRLCIRASKTILSSEFAKVNHSATAACDQCSGSSYHEVVVARPRISVWQTDEQTTWTNTTGGPHIVAGQLIATVYQHTGRRTNIRCHSNVSQSRIATLAKVRAKRCRHTVDVEWLTAICLTSYQQTESKNETS